MRRWTPAYLLPTLESRSSFSLYVSSLLSDIAFCAGHIEAEFLNGSRLGIKFADNLTLIHDEYAVGDVHDLVQFQGNEQHGFAVVALGDELLVDVFDGSHVKAAGGLHSNQKLGVLSISRATMAFC